LVPPSSFLFTFKTKVSEQPKRKEKYILFSIALVYLLIYNVRFSLIFNPFSSFSFFFLFPLLLLSFSSSLRKEEEEKKIENAVKDFHPQRQHQKGRIPS